MRRVLTALLFVGLTGSLIAQAPTAQAPNSQPVKGSFFVRDGHVIDFTAGRSQMNGDRPVTEMSGGVRIKINGVEIAADEATMDIRAGEMRLRGDVRVMLR